jgi:hypothetical protein
MVPSVAANSGPFNAFCVCKGVWRIVNATPATRAASVVGEVSHPYQIGAESVKHSVSDLVIFPTVQVDVASVAALRAYAGNEFASLGCCGRVNSEPDFRLSSSIPPNVPIEPFLSVAVIVQGSGFKLTGTSVKRQAVVVFFAFKSAFCFDYLCAEEIPFQPFNVMSKGAGVFKPRFCVDVIKHTVQRVDEGNGFRPDQGAEAAAAENSLAENLLFVSLFHLLKLPKVRVSCFAFPVERFPKDFLAASGKGGSNPVKRGVGEFKRPFGEV